MELSAALDVAGTAARPRYDAEQGALVGSRCESCGAMAWPMRAVCHGCGRAAPAETVFAAAGTLLSFTTMWVGPDGLPVPYRIGQVRLDKGPLIFAHIRGLGGETKTPATVRLRLADDPHTVPPFWFEPEDAS
jgi:uncharacterized OB-fold protein